MSFEPEKETKHHYEPIHNFTNVGLPYILRSAYQTILFVEANMVAHFPHNNCICKAMINQNWFLRYKIWKEVIMNDKNKTTLTTTSNCSFNQ